MGIESGLLYEMNGNTFYESLVEAYETCFPEISKEDFFTFIPENLFQLKSETKIEVQYIREFPEISSRFFFILSNVEEIESSTEIAIDLGDHILFDFLSRLCKTAKKYLNET